MLKHFYKTFIISMICGSLSIMQPSIAFAAGTNTTDQNGVITNTQTKTFDKVSDADMLTSLAMLGGGFIAARMVASYTPLTMDVTIAGAAGVAFIAGEVITNVKFKGTIDEMTIQVQKKSDGTINEEQIQRLQDLRKSYEEAKETTETKKTLQTAAAVGFAAASATAIYFAMAEDVQVANCSAALKFAVTKLKVCAASTATSNPEGVACGACVGAFTTVDQILSAYKVERGVPAPSKLKDIGTMKEETALTSPLQCAPAGPVTTAAISTMKSVCIPTFMTLMKNQTQTQAPAGIVNSDLKLLEKILKTPIYTNIPYRKIQPENTALLEKALNVFFPTAEASWLPMLGLSAGVLATFIPMTAAAATEIDFMMYVPKNRAIAFGALAGIAFMASKSSENVIEQIDRNISKIDTILADLNKMALGVKAQNISQQAIKTKTISTPNQQAIKFSSNAALRTDCINNASSDSCKGITEQLKSMPGFSNLPESFQDIASQTTGLGDKLSGSTGISGSALADAQSLGSKQNAVKKVLSNREAAFEKLSNGKLDFNKEKGKFLGNMKNAIRKSLQKKGMTATGMMASIGATPISGSSKNEKTELENKATGTANVVDMSAAGSAGKEKEDSLNLNFKEEAAAPVDMAGGVAASAAAPEYLIDSKEINGEHGPSLFEVISSRYIKSGYPKLLEEEPAKN